MFISTIIPTIGRDTLAQAVESVLNQRFEDDKFEIIVVNDSGVPLPDSKWQNSEKVKIIHTNKRNRSVARNAGAAIAQGKYFHFLDDDDWIMPGAFKEFWRLANNSDAAWLYGNFRLVDNFGTLIADISPNVSRNCTVQLLAWEYLPLQASLISSVAFFRVGGFASLYTLLGGFEDVDISRQISLHYSFARIDYLVAVIQIGEATSTTNYVDMFKQNRKSRERVLGTDGAFNRLINSSKLASSQSSYWNGKVIYYYMASLKWNFKRRHFCTAVSRFSFILLVIFLSVRHFLSLDFWHGVIKPHYPRVWIALQQAGVDYLSNETKKRIVEDEKGI